MKKPNDINVLIACEESQRVASAFRARGFNAFSCDIQECTGGHPEFHINDDVLPYLNPKRLTVTGEYGILFSTCDGKHHLICDRWDLIIAHPPCTYLSNAGACRLYPHKGQIDEERYQKGLEGKAFFMKMLNADCHRIAVENPVPSRIFGLPEKTQVIQPYEYGHPYTKKTYLWLKGLPMLMPTHIVTPLGGYVCGNSAIWKKQAAAGGVVGKEKDAKHRSKTFPGIALAMAAQWGDYLLETL